MATELEWKYAVPDRALLDRICTENGNAWQEIAMESFYYDTEDGALTSRRWTLRLRRENGETVICLKTPGTAADGAHARGEWEWRGGSIQEAVPRLLALGAPAELQALTAEKGLCLLCGAEFTRRAAWITLPEAELELAADWGSLVGGGRREVLCELEAEHKSGKPEATAAFAEGLAKRYGLALEPKSKFQRAMALTR